MESIDISIKKAKIHGYQVTLGDNIPNVSATIQLLTEGGKEITSYSISTDHWQSNLKFELPLGMVGPIVDIARQLEAIVSKHCQNSALGITHVPAPEIVPDVPKDAKPIDDIPF